MIETIKKNKRPYESPQTENVLLGLYSQVQQEEFTVVSGEGEQFGKKVDLDDDFSFDEAGGVEDWNDAEFSTPPSWE